MKNKYKHARIVGLGILYSFILFILTYWFTSNYYLQSPVLLRTPFVERYKKVVPTITPTKKPTATPTPTSAAKFERKGDEIVPIKKQSVNITDQEIADYIKTKDWDYSIAIRLAKSENFWNLTKSFNCERVGGQNPDGTYDYGIFQINSIHSRTLAKFGMTIEDMKDCKKNIDFAYNWVYKGSGWGAWSAFNNESYLGHNIQI